MSWGDKAEADVVVAVVGRIVLAIGDATVPRLVVPTAATQHTVCASYGC